MIYCSNTQKNDYQGNTYNSHMKTCVVQNQNPVGLHVQFKPPATQRFRKCKNEKNKIAVQQPAK